MPQHFTFSRHHIAGTYFKDLKLPVQYGKKIDFYENDELTGTLVDEELHAKALFRGGKLITTKVKSRFRNLYRFNLVYETGQPFASGEVDRDGQKYCITFFKENTTYQYKEQYNSSVYAYRRTGIFYIGKEIYCQIDYLPFPETGSWFKKHLSKVDFKGVISLNDSLNKEHLLGFFLLFNRKL